MNWKEILALIIPGLTTIITLIVLLIIKGIYKKTTKKETPKLDELISAIIDAELELGAKQGAAKKNYVLNKCNVKPKEVDKVVEILNLGKNEIEKRGIK